MWTSNEMELMRDDEDDPNTLSQTNSMPILCLNYPNRFPHYQFLIIKMLPWEHKTTNISFGKSLWKKITAQMCLAPQVYMVQTPGCTPQIHSSVPRDLLNICNVFYFHFPRANLLQNPQIPISILYVLETEKQLHQWTQNAQINQE